MTTCIPTSFRAPGDPRAPHPAQPVGTYLSCLAGLHQHLPREGVHGSLLAPAPCCGTYLPAIQPAWVLACHCLPKARRHPKAAVISQRCDTLHLHITTFLTMASSNDEPHPPVAQLVQTSGIIVTGTPPPRLTVATQAPRLQIPCATAPITAIHGHTTDSMALQMSQSSTWSPTLRTTKVSALSVFFILSPTDARTLGRALLNRLLLIASTSTVLAVDALKLAADQAWAYGKDVLLYQAICDEMRSLCPAEREVIVDKKWVERTIKNNKAELHRLESELKGYKNNLIKESIRVRTWVDRDVKSSC